MDPDETLRALRKAINDSREASDKAEAYDMLAIARIHAEALDAWLTRGGFLPDAWDHRDCPTGEVPGSRYAGDRSVSATDPTTWAPWR